MKIDNPSCTASLSVPSKLLIVVLSLVLGFPLAPATAQTGAVPISANATVTPSASSPSYSEGQLAALVAPIALYPDPLIAQILMASTYPFQVSDAYNWQKANSALQGEALNQALQQHNWDPSVKSLVSFPAVLGMMGSQLGWTNELGEAVLSQQTDVMHAIQILRVRARDSGALGSNSQQLVTTEGSGQNQTVLIQPANPSVVYVPTYNPAIVYGVWPYPNYRPYSYYPVGYIPGPTLLSFGVGIIVGSALWGAINWGHYGWGRGWGWGPPAWRGANWITINNNNYNNFNRYTNRNWSGWRNNGFSDWKARGAHPESSFKPIPPGGYGRVNNFNRNEARDQLRHSLQHDGIQGNRIMQPHNDNRNRSVTEYSRSAGGPNGAKYNAIAPPSRDRGQNFRGYMNQSNGHPEYRTDSQTKGQNHQSWNPEGHRGGRGEGSHP